MVIFRGEQNMYKEIIIVCIIVFAILVTDFITQNFTKESIKSIEDNLNIIKESINNNESQNLNNQIKELEDKWAQIDNKMSFYIEHNELEKVNSSLVKFKSYIELEDYQEAITELEECKYILEHIKDKQRMQIINLF